jgi:hypothetical protein
LAYFRDPNAEAFGKGDCPPEPLRGSPRGLSEKQMTFYVIGRLFPSRFSIENRWLTISLVG